VARAASGADRSADPNADADPESVARAIALRMLERAPRTRAELARAMARRGVPADAATAVLDRFVEVGMVDDEAFAAAWVDSRHAGRGLARRALSAELRQRGVDADVIRDAVDVVSADDEETAATALVRRRLPTLSRLPRETQIRRLVGMLARKGFSQGLAMRVVRDALATQDPNNYGSSAF
jgi:regulatory protein